MAFASIERDGRRFKSAAVDAVEDGVLAARRAIQSAQRYAEDLTDLKDEAIRRVKRQPLQVVGAALGVGMVLGMVGTLMAMRVARRD